MATYLQGVTGYIPNIQPFKPDYNFYQGVHQRHDAKYEAGWEKMNSVYNGILNSPMMRSQNVERRDEFFKNIQGQIQQMSAVDLSLPQNVDQATQVFKPFYEDANIVKDIGFTNRYQKAMKESEYYRTCTDKKKCGDKYWGGGVKLLNYKAQDFINATDEQALSMAAPSYVPYANLQKKAEEAIKEMGGGYEMEYESTQGKWLVKEKGGARAVQPLMNFMAGRFSDDPELTAFFGAKAELLRREDPEAAINIYELSKIQSEANSPEELQQRIAERADEINVDKAKKVTNETDAGARATYQQLLLKKQGIETKISNEGIVPGGEDDKSYRDILNSQEGVKNTSEEATQAAEIANKLQYIDENGNKIPNSSIDGVVAQAMMGRQMNLTANTLAYKNYSRTVKADPYALAGFKNDLNMKRDRINNQAKYKNTVLAGMKKSADEYKTQLKLHGLWNWQTDAAFHIDPDKQTFPILPGGGMAGSLTGSPDPMDRYAAAKYQIEQGNNPFQNTVAHTNAGGNTFSPQDLYRKTGMSKKKVDGKTRVTEASGAPELTVNEAKSLYGKAYKKYTPLRVAPDTEYKGKFGEIDIFHDYTKNVNGDTRMEEAIFAVKNGYSKGTGDFLGKIDTQLDRLDPATKALGTLAKDKVIGDLKHINGTDAGINFMSTFQDIFSSTKQLAEAPAKAAVIAQNSFVSEQINNTLVALSNPDNPAYADAFAILTSIGNKIKQTGRGNSPQKDQLIKDGTWDILSKMPTTNNIDGLTDDYVRELRNANVVDDMIIAAGGLEGMFNMFGSTKERTYQTTYDGNDLTDKADLIDEETFNSLSDRDHDIALWRSINSTVEKLGEDVYRQGDPNLAFWKANPNGFQPLNKDEQKAIKDYDYYTTQPSIPNQAGMNSTIPSFKNTSSQKLDDLAESKIMIDATKRSKANFKNQMTQRSREFAGTYDEEDTSIGEKIVADNIWSETKDGWGNFTSLPTHYNNAIAKLSSKEYVSTWETNNLYGTKTIPELEEAYGAPGHQMFKGDNLKQLVKHSNFTWKEMPKNINKKALYDNYMKSMSGEVAARTKAMQEGKYAGPAALTGPSGRVLSPEQLFSGAQGNNRKLWNIILDDEQTKMHRKDGRVSVESPYLSGTLQPSYKMDSFNASSVYNRTFDDIEENVNRLRAEFTDASQHIPEGKSSQFAIFPTSKTQTPGAYSFYGPTVTGLNLTAGLHTDEYDAAAPMIQEAFDKYDQDMTKFNIQGSKGDKSVLELINNTVNDDQQVWQANDKGRPQFGMEIETVAGHLDMAKMNIHIDRETNIEWLKDQGLAKWDSKEGQWNYLIEEDYSYYVPNSKNKMVTNTKPDPFTTVVGFTEKDGPYRDDFFKNGFKAYAEYQRSGEWVDYKVVSKDYLGKEVVAHGRSKYEGPGISWRNIMKENRQMVYANPDMQIQAEVMMDVQRINSLDHYQQ